MTQSCKTITVTQFYNGKLARLIQMVSWHVWYIVKYFFVSSNSQAYYGKFHFFSAILQFFELNRIGSMVETAFEIHPLKVLTFRPCFFSSDNVYSLKKCCVKEVTCDHRLVRNFFDKTFSFRFGDVEVKAGRKSEKSEK